MKVGAVQSAIGVVLAAISEHKLVVLWVFAIVD